MTQEEFDQLPGLMSAALFLRITGLSKHKLRTLVRVGNLQFYVGPPKLGRRGAYRKFFKRDAARLSGFQFK